MKKILFGLCGLFLVASVTSCKREYTCTCVYPGSTIGTTKTSIEAKKKSDAENTCSNLNTAAKAQGGSCAL